jgi:hypothetical protein
MATRLLAAIRVAEHDLMPTARKRVGATLDADTDPLRSTTPQ